MADRYQSLPPQAQAAIQYKRNKAAEAGYELTLEQTIDEYESAVRNLIETTNSTAEGFIPLFVEWMQDQRPICYDGFFDDEEEALQFSQKHGGEVEQIGPRVWKVHQ